MAHIEFIWKSGGQRATNDEYRQVEHAVTLIAESFVLVVCKLQGRPGEGKPVRAIFTGDCRHGFVDSPSIELSYRHDPEHPFLEAASSQMDLGEFGRTALSLSHDQNPFQVVYDPRNVARPQVQTNTSLVSLTDAYLADGRRCLEVRTRRSPAVDHEERLLPEYLEQGQILLDWYWQEPFGGGRQRDARWKIVSTSDELAIFDGQVVVSMRMVIEDDATVQRNYTLGRIQGRASRSGGHGQQWRAYERR